MRVFRLLALPAVCLPLVLLPGLAAPPEVPAPEKALPGAVRLHVDASDISRNLVRARLEIPAAPGPLALLYPRWIPGNHGPTGPIADLTGIRVRAGEATIPWRRDDLDAYRLHCTVPEGASGVTVDLELLASGGVSSSTTGTPQLGVVNWNQVLLYPEGPRALGRRFHGSLMLPAGWKLGTALTTLATMDATTTFAPVTLEELVDSPVLCGVHLKEIAIGPDTGPRHWLVAACDDEAGLALTPATKAGFDRLVAEAHALFGARHYRSYRFLLALSDKLGSNGLEHHESSDNRLPERALVDEFFRRATISLFPHEYTHSWNGKYRRPAEMITADFQAPQKTKLLWVYEGLTHYLTLVLTVRSGLWSADDARDFLATVAEEMANRRGRSWRPLEDTATAAASFTRESRSWASRRRTKGDYYDEGVLLWLEVDTLIRTQTRGAKSLDDFCRAFFGGESGPPSVRPYTFDDLIASLEAVSKHDWRTHLTRRVQGVTDAAPLDGLSLGGWRLTHGDKPTAFQKAQDGAAKVLDLTASLGLMLTNEGVVRDVVPGTPGDKAGVGPGMKVVAVNGRRFGPSRLTDAVAETARSGKVELLLENGDFFRTHTLEYRGGAKYPRLDVTDRPDRLGEILKGRTGGT